METLLPNKIARSVELPDGSGVRVRTLTSLEREAARDAADLAAARAVHPFYKGERAEMLAEEFSDLTPDDAVAFLMARQLTEGAWIVEAWEQWPEPLEPGRKPKETDVEFDERVAAWETAREEARTKRQQFLADRYGEHQAKISRLSDAERLAECCREWRRRKRQAEFAKRVTREILLRAVRVSEADDSPVYPDGDAFDRLDDAVIELLWAAYNGVDTVAPEAVPTTPPGS
jgi:hypothetical protein